ncbi:2-nitropropane dioxygenase [Mycena latifolia]|nr:2-nitropropane dioxygenase [Mycena latifolia]
MQPISTKFTQLLNLKSPVVSAPMNFASTPSLAVAVSAAGGLGMIAGGPNSSTQIKEQLHAVRMSLNIPSNHSIPVGVGLVGWILDKTEISTEARIPCVLEEMPAAIWLAFGVDLGKYVAQVRAYDANRAYKTRVFVMVNSVSEAIRAANVWKVDVIVVQGVEAGGHCHSQAPPLFTLLQAVRDVIPCTGPCILATGGVSSGAQIAALLTMGADGVVLGTRFMYTHECMYPDAVKDVLVECPLGSTIRGHMFDEALALPFKVEWPEGINGRGIANKVVDDASEGLTIEERIRRVEDAQSRGETDRLIIWAGVGVGLVKTIGRTADVFAQLHEDAVTALKNSRRLLG